MSTYTLVILLSFSVAIPAVIGLVRFKKISPAYYPFLFSIWIGLVVEVISYIITHQGYSNSVLYIIHSLIEALLLTWFFKSIGLFRRPRSLFVILIMVFILFWVIEISFFASLKTPVTYFRSFYSFAVVLMSIVAVSREFNRERKNMLKNPVFIIAVTSIISYTYTAVIGVFWLYGLSMSRNFRMNIVWILIFINLFSNLMYAIAILWIPIKRQFLSLS